MKNSTSSCLALGFVCFSYSYFSFPVASMPSLLNPSNNSISCTFPWKSWRWFFSVLCWSVALCCCRAVPFPHPLCSPGASPWRRSPSRGTDRRFCSSDECSEAGRRAGTLNRHSLKRLWIVCLSGLWIAQSSPRLRKGLRKALCTYVRSPRNSEIWDAVRQLSKDRESWGCPC